MKDIELNWYKRIIYVLGWIGVIQSILFIMVSAGIYLVKDYGDKRIKGKLTRSFEKFIYGYGWFYLSFIGVVLILVIFGVL